MILTSEDGPDGEDTSFIIKADSVVGASSLADDVLCKMPHKKVACFCHRITRIGESNSTNNKPSIVMGPFVGAAIMHDDEGIDNSERWIRDDQDEGWISFLDYYED